MKRNKLDSQFKAQKNNKTKRKNIKRMKKKEEIHEIENRKHFVQISTPKSRL